MKSSSFKCLWSICERITVYFLNNRRRLSEHFLGYCRIICRIFGEGIFDFFWLSKSTDRKVHYQYYCAFSTFCFQSVTKMHVVLTFFNIIYKHVVNCNINEIRAGTSRISYLCLGSILVKEKIRRKLKIFERTWKFQLKFCCFVCWNQRFWY